MILRFQSRDGNFRLNVQPDQDIASILPEVLAKLPKTAVPSSIQISPKPHGGEMRPLEKMKGVTFSRIGLVENGTMIYLSFDDEVAATSNGHHAAASKLSGKEVTQKELESVAINVAPTLIKNPWETVKQSELDDRLDKLDGKIRRKKDPKMCRHNAHGMCDYCQPVEPYDKGYLEENKIKHMSFHAYLRQKNQGKNKSESGSSYMTPLSEPYFRVNPNCPSGHKPFPAGICSKCQPSAISLQPQLYRMVDHVEFQDFAIVNRFLDFWRRGGAQRIGFMYGRYEQYDMVPLGTKAVVEAIYEPPQIDEPDGVTMAEWENEEAIDKLAELSGLQRVGVIFTDLLAPPNPDQGTAVCKRHADSYFLSSLEVCFAARYQAKYPRPSKWSETGKFGSNFVTCVISGDTDGQIGISAYMASNDAVEMERAQIIEPSADPAVMLVQDEEEVDRLGQQRYVPEVFYRKINEYGANVQENAKPSFPVEYLFVTLTHGFPDDPTPMFAKNEFTIENRDALGELQEPRDLQKQLKAGANRVALDTPQGVAVVSDFHALTYIQSLGILSEDEMKLLCQVAIKKDAALGATLMHTPGWLTLLAILDEHGVRPAKRGTIADFSSELSKKIKGMSMDGRRL
ncbi:hypothetical protein CKM354_000637000 [Cercospora kikuchii]|uniref:Nuclear protein localization protein 4 n=1 Tax=Cercospora kikuchii TaxID=84275 RepID=A0A9P3CMC7_9PEZI|nr:uncharacterized protein CKM354_000637000 [Cercospora kikuchii]GIZ43130.1 hypothetical protein CKM354_000637000 [Cercospora kikuchii]